MGFAVLDPTAGLVPAVSVEADLSVLAPTATPPSITLGGNEITDALRTAQGPVDGFLPAKLGGVGIWPAHTNTAPNTTFASVTTGWVGFASTVLSVDATQTDLPFPSHNALKNVCTAAGAGCNLTATYRPAAATGQTWVFSCWVKGTAGNSVLIEIGGRTSGGAASESFTSTITFTGAWQRVSITCTLAVATTVSLTPEIQVNAPTSQTFWMAAPMVAKSPDNGTPYDFPYIANATTTIGVTTTRAAGRVRAAAAGVINATKGWVAMVLAPGYPAQPVAQALFAASWQTDGSNFLGLRVSTGGAGPFDAIDDNATVQTAARQSVAYTEAQQVLLVMAWDSTKIYLSVNGAPFTSATPVARVLPNGSTFDIGSLAGAQQVGGNIVWFACGTGTFTSADLASLAAYGGNEPALPPNANVQLLWPCVTAATDRPWTEVTTLVRQLQYQRSGRNQEINRSAAGSLSAICSDTAGALTSLGLRKRQWLRVRALWQSTVIPRWQGVLETVPRKWPGQGADQLVEFHAADAFKILGLVDLAGNTYSSQRNDQRVSSILTSCGVTAGAIDTNTDTADAVSTAMPQGTMALDYLLQIEASENGLLVANPDATVDFQGRHYRLKSSSTPLATFGETAGQIPYLDDVEYDDDDSLVANIAAVTPLGASSAVVATNTAATAKNWPTRIDRNLLSSSVPLATSAAQWLAKIYGDPSPRIPAINVELAATARVNPTLVTTLLNAKNSSRFTWTRQASTPISQDVYVEQITETIDVAGGSWQIGLQLSPVVDEAAWILGTSKLGQDTALAY